MGRPFLIWEPVSIRLEYTPKLELSKVSCKYKHGEEHTVDGEEECQVFLEGLGKPQR